MAYAKNLPKKTENLSDWYNAVVLQAELAEYGPAKGTMIIRPYGYAIWEEIQKQLDLEFKKKGVENAYFPMFIPESLFNKEAEHIEGFSPELAVVTIGGGEELKEKLIVRPTSETIIGNSFAKWINSWRDLPMMINQWVNVVRWEKRTYMFLRTTEFLWQEGHTAHATHQEAQDLQQWAMDVYIKTFKDLFAMPGYSGKKSERGKFAGADMTLTYETLMPEGKALQSCTSHDLGQSFGKSFDIKFHNKEGELEYVWQTSWGLSTRSIGGLIMMHGDDKGLRLPPKLAPIQAIILPVRLDEEILDYCSMVSSKLVEAGIRVRVDLRDGETLGWKINKWEVKGAPLRIEIGQSEVGANTAKLVRRDTGEVIDIRINDITQTVSEQLEAIQKNLQDEATIFLKENTHSIKDYDQLKEVMRGKKGFAEGYWCGDAKCEEKIKEETKATIRCSGDSGEQGNCICCGKEGTEIWYFAQAY